MDCFRNAPSAASCCHRHLPVVPCRVARRLVCATVLAIPPMLILLLIASSSFATSGYDDSSAPSQRLLDVAVEAPTAAGLANSRGTLVRGDALAPVVEMLCSSVSPSSSSPTTTFIEAYPAQVSRASLCGSSIDPLRIAFVLLGADDGDGGERRKPQSAVALEGVTAQVKALLRGLAKADGDNGQLGPFLREAVVTIVSPYSADANAATGPALEAIVATVLFTNGNAVEHRAPAAVTIGNGTDALLAALSMAQQRPHFTYALPPSALFTPLNVAGVCILEPMLSSNAGEEREAKAYYPQDRGDDSNRRASSSLPLGFVLTRKRRKKVSLQELEALAAVKKRGESLRGGGSNSSPAPSSPPITLVSSCRMPLSFKAGELPPIDGRHHTKGGDVVLKGFGRFVRVSLSSLEAGSEGTSTSRRGPFVHVPFYGGGVRPEVILSDVGTAQQEHYGLGMGGGRPFGGSRGRGASSSSALSAVGASIFQMARPSLEGCSDDPIKNPTRVVTVMPFFITEALLQRKGLDVLLRTVKAAAHMTPHSDLILVTNVPYRAFVTVMRAAAKGEKVDGRMLNSTLLFSSPAQNRDEEAEVLLDADYPNPLGTLVVIDASHPANSGHFINGLAEEAVIAAKGFYDVVRYSEEDVYITRDQFEFYCATLPWMEERNYYLNYMRFEFNASLDGGDPTVANTQRPPAVDVLRAYLPPSNRLTFVDLLPTIPFEAWTWGLAAQSVVLTKRRGVHHRDGSHFDRVGGGGGAESPLLYDVEEVKVGTCHLPPYYPAADPQPADGGDLAGCYTLRPPVNPQWVSSRVYNAMYMVPSHRIGWLTARNRMYLYRPRGQDLDREYVAHFKCPLNAYVVGMMVFTPSGGGGTPRRGGDGGTGDTDTGGANAATRQRVPYGASRLGAIHHGGDMYLRRHNASELLQANVFAGVLDPQL